MLLKPSAEHSTYAVELQVVLGMFKLAGADVD
jgi:hypothetical protein